MTIRDVAARAGVSAATVSRVFTNPESVAAETRRRVMATAEEMGYSPNRTARALVQGRSGNVGIVLPDMANSFSAVIAKAVQREVRRAGHALFITDSDFDASDEVRWARAMAPQVDGLILISPLMGHDEVLELAKLTSVVMLNREIDGIPAVLVSSTAGAEQAVEHLSALGHRNLAYLAGPEGYSNTSRLTGFRTACERLRLTGHELGAFPARFTAGVRAADMVLATPATAVVAYNDEMAVGVINRLADRGVHVPDQVSVVGFDDTGLAEMVIPRLTSVRLPATPAGAALAHLLIDVIGGRDELVRDRTELTAELIVRASTGPAPPVPLTQDLVDA